MTTRRKGARYKDYFGCVEWLVNSGIANRWYCLEFPKLWLSKAMTSFITRGRILRWRRIFLCVSVEEIFRRKTENYILKPWTKNILNLVQDVDAR